ncbi:EAL domain-containing protein [Cyanobacterium stanieri LEGE 03274]|uniref:EAL domain-containing protein n=1 Tax=Cyanobacterium stanieri LEGE 03274 TaxID=1828756 RepID=A0ABR9V5W1_9CHRO|nr:EAL domain-containing protein [Cyanobacterium stanieri]MBE9223277.1 EAL domain-containing protein [Cyanobacterium stanieri LEGE 03274]
MSETQEFRHILVIEDRKGRRILSLEENNYTLGRDSNNPIVIYDYQVSRTHATLVKKEDTQGSTYRIVDGDLQGKRSTNGILVNGHATLSHELKHGDTIRFANEAKANYYIIATESGIDLFNPDDLGNLNARSTLTSPTTQTMISKQEEQENPQDQEELIRLASFPELSPHPIIEVDWDGNITYLNPAASIKFENLYEEKLNHPILSDLLVESNNRQGNLFLREVKIGTEVFEQYVHYLSEKKLIRSYIFDFTKRKQAEAQLKESEARYRAILRQTSEGIILAYAHNKKIIEVNGAYAKMIGYSPEEIREMTLYNLIASDLQLFNQDLARIAERKQDTLAQYIHRCKDGTLLNLESNISLISYQNKDIFSIVVKNVPEVNQGIHNSNYHNFYDSLTNLANKRLLEKQLDIALSSAKSYQHFLGLITLEIKGLDSFKRVRGEEETNKFLQNFAQTFESCLRSFDLAARWDENKFIALFSRIRGPRDPAKIAKRISMVFEQYIQQQKGNTDLDLNISMVVYPLDGETAEHLLQSALISTDQGNYDESNVVSWSGFRISPKTASLLRLENLIGSAIQEKQFYLCYQPQLNLADHSLMGMETLLRWNHPELGKITPKHFLRLAEETDFMLPLGVWILQTAAAQMKQWSNQGLSTSPVTVNISSRQFNQDSFVDLVATILRETGLPPQLLELEIMENALLQNPTLAASSLKQLSDLKVRLCLDNFGVGGSSLGHLQQFPFDTVKISPSVIAKLESNHGLKAFVRAIVSFSQGYNQRVVAVGVEKNTQLELLKGLDCTQIQGNFFSSPLTSQEATTFLEKGDFHLPR